VLRDNNSIAHASQWRCIWSSARVQVRISSIFPPSSDGLVVVVHRTSYTHSCIPSRLCPPLPELPQISCAPHSSSTAHQSLCSAPLHFNGRGIDGLVGGLTICSSSQQVRKSAQPPLAAALLQLTHASTHTAPLSLLFPS